LIAAAGNCPDQACPIVSEGAPQLTDALHQHIIRNREVRPNRSKEFIVRDKTAGIFNQVAQDREDLWPKGNLVLSEKKTAAIQIQDTAVKP
jgi:hypothetical protein